MEQGYREVVESIEIVDDFIGSKDSLFSNFEGIGYLLVHIVEKIEIQVSEISQQGHEQIIQDDKQMFRDFIINS